VHDTRLVRGGEPGRNLPRKRERASQRQSTLPEDGREIRALHAGHRQVERAVDFAEVVNADDVRRGDLARQLQLTFEAILELADVRHLHARVDANELQCDRGGERLVPRLVDRRHAAGAEQADDGVAVGECLARLQNRRTAQVRRSRRGGAGDALLGWIGEPGGIGVGAEGVGTEGVNRGIRHGPRYRRVADDTPVHGRRRSCTTVRAEHRLACGTCGRLSHRKGANKDQHDTPAASTNRRRRPGAHRFRLRPLGLGQRCGFTNCDDHRLLVEGRPIVAQAP
jgi:hypothetical protein